MPNSQTSLSEYIDWFLIGLVAVFILATVWPDLGRSQGNLKLGQFTNAGVCLLFFLHGMGLSGSRLKEGASKWRLHTLVQLSTYVIFPLWWFLLAFVFKNHVSPDVLMGFFYLAVLPSTVSSSVAMTAMARGEVGAAVFNATLSMLMGIWLTPLMVGFLLPSNGLPIDVTGSMLNILQMLFLPFLTGHILRPWLATWFDTVKPMTNVLDRSVILLLVLVAFSDSVAEGLWTRHGYGLLIQMFLGACLFLFPMLWFTRFVSKRLGFTIEEEIVAVFCGSKKTLASGIPMAKLLFAHHPAIGVLVLPIIFYHQIQLFVCTLLARRYAKRPTH